LQEGEGSAAEAVETMRVYPVEIEILEDVLAEEAEKAFENTGDQSTGDTENLPSVEFYYGKVRQNGKWIKTGKIYWIFTVYQNGQRKRLSPSRIYGKQKGITSIEQCPFKGRIFDFYRRSLGFKTTGDPSDGGRFQRIEGRTTGEQDHQ
jgi:hypothetical protein